MGLDTSHNCWHAPYGTFNTFRRNLALQLGINLKDYKGYAGGGILDLESIDHPLMPLFNHSDCDGELSVSESKSIIEGFDDILLGETGEIKGFETQFEIDDFLAKINQFRDGLVDAVSKNEVVDFH